MVVNLLEPPSLLRNDVTGGGNWLKVKLEGVKSNRSAIGARVTLSYGGKREVQEVMSQGSFYSVNDFRLHFGLGSVGVVDVEVRWPLGGVELFRKVAAGQLVEIKEGAGIVKATAWKKKG